MNVRLVLMFANPGNCNSWSALVLRTPGFLWSIETGNYKSVTTEKGWGGRGGTQREGAKRDDLCGYARPGYGSPPFSPAKSRLNSNTNMSYSVKYLDGENEEVEYIARAGKAEVTYANGHTYIGTFNDTKMRHGKGTYTWNVVPTEDEETEEEPLPPAVYTGDYTNGCREGIGKMTFPDGSTYFGEWFRNTMHGEGTYKYTNGDIYSGAWVSGQKTGRGTYQFKLTKFTPKSEEDKSDKEKEDEKVANALYGPQKYRNDSLFDGEWVDGSIVSGTWTYKDGTTFNGPFMEGFPCGQGEYNFASGNKQAGEFIRVQVANSTDEFATRPLWVHGGNAQSC